MQPSIHRAIEPNVDGGSTNKCKKNTAFIIITSMLAGLRDTTRDSSSFASGDFFILPLTFAKKKVPETVDILKPLPSQTYRDNFFIFSLKFKSCITSCECMNFVTLYSLFKSCRVFNAFFNKFLTCLPTNNFNI